MNLAKELEVLEPKVGSSPLAGHEYVNGYALAAMPFDSGHVLGLRVMPENDFAPYRSVWHRTPAGDWSIYLDAPRLDIGCGRYYSSGARRVEHADIKVRWLGPSELTVQMEEPKLEWTLSLTASPLVRGMNAMIRRLPDPLWRQGWMLHSMEGMAAALFNLGRITLLGTVPNGHLTTFLPKRMFFVAAANAKLEGRDLGQPTRSQETPAIGEIRLPARPLFFIGQAYAVMQDPEEYRRTVAELREQRMAALSVST